MQELGADKPLRWWRAVDSLPKRVRTAETLQERAGQEKKGGHRRHGP